MANIIKGLIGVSAFAFVLAVIGSIFHINFIGVPPEAFSRACNNLVLMAIALTLSFKVEAKGN
jgi:hypothetical protein